jgi:hypothetical protein
LSKRFYIVEGLFDQWVGIPLEQALEKKGLRQMRSETFSKPLTSAIFRNFYNMMIDNRLVLYNYPKLVDANGIEQHCEYIAELLSLQAEFQSKYITIVEAPSGPDNHDDMSDALVRMVWCASQAMGQGRHLSTGRGHHLRGNRGPTPGSISRARRKALLGGSDIKRMNPERARAGGMSPYRGMVMVSHKKKKRRK